MLGRRIVRLPGVKYPNRMLRTVRDLIGVESNREIERRLLELVQH